MFGLGNCFRGWAGYRRLTVLAASAFAQLVASFNRRGTVRTTMVLLCVANGGCSESIAAELLTELSCTCASAQPHGVFWHGITRGCIWTWFGSYLLMTALLR